MYWLKEGGRTPAAANRRRLRPCSGNRSPSDQNEQRDFVEESGKEGKGPLYTQTRKQMLVRLECNTQYANTILSLLIYTNYTSIFYTNV